MKRIIFLFLIGILLSSCGDSIVNNDLGYKEHLVVRGILVAGEPITVYFGKSLPLQQTFDSANANLKNVFAYITHNLKNDTMYYTGNGIYKCKSLIAQNGETYSLFANWNNSVVRSETSVPFTASFQNASLDTVIENNDTSFTVKGVLTPRPGAVYGATWSIISSNPSYVLEDSVISILAREKDKDLLGNLLIKTRKISIDLVRKWRSNLFIRVHAFDEQIYNFFITQDANNASNNIFGNSGVNLRWNVSGDGIGMFIGKTDFIVRVK
jgi:hypothetical protein